MYSTQQTSAAPRTVVNANPSRVGPSFVRPKIGQFQQRFQTPTVIVSNFYTSTTNVLTGSGQAPTRVIMNNRLANSYTQLPTTSSLDPHQRLSSATYVTNSAGHYVPKVVVDGSDHDYNMPIYIPASSNLVVRPTTVLSSQHPGRSSSLSYATSQRACDVPETMKLPTLRGLPAVSRSVANAEPEVSGCARVRQFTSNHDRDKFSMDYKDDSRSFGDKRKRDFAQANRPTITKNVTEYAGPNGHHSHALNGSKDSKLHLQHSTMRTGFNDDQNVVLRVDGDVKMIVDCDRESDAFAPPPKKNRPGRPRKYAEGTKPPRKEDDPEKKRRNRFKRRTQDEYQQVLEEINVKGLDAEDIGFLRTMFGQYQLDTTNDTDVPWGQRIPWLEAVLPPNPAIIPQPARLINGRPEPYYADEDLRNLVPNGSGCARSEPYQRYLMRQAVAAENESALEESLHDHKFEDVKPIRKRLASKIDTNVNENMPFKLVQYPNSIKLKVAKVLVPSTQKNGVFAMETVEPNKTVVEFTGEILRLDAAYTRELRYEEMGIASNMFKFDEEYVLDATREGSVARFIKHSCKPNCKAVGKIVNGVRRIFIQSTTYIDKNEELSFEYNLSGRTPRVECKCGAKYCQGRI